MNAVPSPAYRAPWWLPGGHLQTLYAPLIGRAPVGWTRKRWDAPDGDFIDVDFLPGAADAPLVVLFHGLEGGSRSHYAVALALELGRIGWRCAVPHFRGCSGEPNRLPRAYHSGDAEEISWILRRFRGESPRAPLCAVGISLGGNALLKWLGEDRGAGDAIALAAAVSAPLDLMAAGDALGRGFNLVYARAFLRTMKPRSAQKLEQFPGLFDADAMQRSRTLREFDDIVTAPLHGFRNTDDYWTRASSKRVLRGITVPTLLINARNDPFLPEAALPRSDQVSPAVRCEFCAEGGHAGFVSGRFPGHLRWLPRRLIAFFREAPGMPEILEQRGANEIMTARHAPAR